MASNIKQNVVFASPRDFAGRTELAEACVRQLHIPIPALIDDFSNSTEKTYTGWPDRLYVIGKNGRVAYKSKPGPFGFSPGGMESALERELK